MTSLDAAIGGGSRLRVATVFPFNKVNMENIPAIIEYDLSAAEQQIRTAWQAFQQAEKLGLDFGRVCAEWRDKFKAQGKKGQGLRQILTKLEIKPGKAYYWINEYEVSIGVKPEPEPEPETQSPGPPAASVLNIKHWQWYTLVQDVLALEDRNQKNDESVTYGQLAKRHGVSVQELADRLKEYANSDFVESAWPEQVRVVGAVEHLLSMYPELCPVHGQSTKPLNGRNSPTLKPTWTPPSLIVSRTYLLTTPSESLSSRTQKPGKFLRSLYDSPKKLKDR